jgi:antitoxin HicB
MWAYPITIEPDDNGTLLLSFLDIPEAHTFANCEDEITTRATDCVLTALEGYIKDRRPIPAPSRELKGRVVVLPPLSAAKIELYEAMRNAGVRKADLARRLQWHMPQVDRLLSLRHGSRLEHLEAALAALDHRLELRIVRGVERRAQVSPRTRIATTAYAAEGAAARGGVGMTARKGDVHVSKGGAGVWKVTQNSRTISTHQKQSTAIQRGQREARQDKVDLVTHGRDGRVRSKDSYGNDPNPPKNREH